jgi:hypothetical protein
MAGPMPAIFTYGERGRAYLSIGHRWNGPDFPHMIACSRESRWVYENWVAESEAVIGWDVRRTEVLRNG